MWLPCRQPVSIYVCRQSENPNWKIYAGDAHTYHASMPHASCPIVHTPYPILFNMLAIHTYIIYIFSPAECDLYEKSQQQAFSAFGSMCVWNILQRLSFLNSISRRRKPEPQLSQKQSQSHMRIQFQMHSEIQMPMAMSLSMAMAKWCRGQPLHK